MHKHILLFLLVVLGWTQSITGYVNPDPGCYALQAEFLYFKPTVEQSFFAVSSSNNVFTSTSGPNIYPDGDRLNNNSLYRPGFRVEGAYALCSGCNLIDVRFAYLNASHSNSVSGPFLFDTIGYPGNGGQAPEDTTYAGEANFKQQFRYYAGDATFDRVIVRCCPEYLAFLFGLHYVYLKVDENFNSSGTFVHEDGGGVDQAILPVSNQLTRTNRFWGIGPQFGIEYSYLLPDCLCWQTGQFSVVASGRASLLCSRSKAEFTYKTLNTGPVGVNLPNDHIWRVTPTVDARVGLNYTCAFHCVCANVEIGYELIWYNDCVDAITGVDVAFAGDSIDVFSNFNLQGPYVAVSVSF